jgi:hypothetical protein
MESKIYLKFHGRTSWSIKEGFERKEITLREYIAWLHHPICLIVESMKPTLVSISAADTHKCRESLKSSMGNINSTHTPTLT